MASWKWICLLAISCIGAKQLHTDTTDDPTTPADDSGGSDTDSSDDTSSSGNDDTGEAGGDGSDPGDWIGCRTVPFGKDEHESGESESEGDDTGDDDPGYIGNTGNFCVPTSEVNLKISEGWIEGGASAEELRDCIVAELAALDNGEGGWCMWTNGFRDNEICWQGLIDAEILCGGPEVVITETSAEEVDPEDPEGLE